jgi:hypothetical protein
MISYYHPDLSVMMNVAREDLRSDSSRAKHSVSFLGEEASYDFS